MTATDWYNATKDAWLVVWDKFAGFFPQAFGALLILVVTGIVAYWLKRLVVYVLKVSGIQMVFEIAQVDTVLRRGGYKEDASTVIGNLFQWAVWITGLLATFSVLELNAINRFFNDMLGYLPMALEALGIFFVGLVIAAFIGRLVTGFLASLSLGWGVVIGSLVQGVLIAFAFFTAFFQLGIPFTLISTLFTGVVAAGAIAVGLAFGLGGQDTVRNLLSRFTKK